MRPLPFLYRFKAVSENGKSLGLRERIWTIVGTRPSMLLSLKNLRSACGRMEISGKYHVTHAQFDATSMNFSLKI